MAIKIPKPPLPGTRRKPKAPEEPRENGRPPVKDVAAVVGTGIIG